MVVQRKARNMSGHAPNRSIRRVSRISFELRAAEIVFDGAVELDLAAFYESHQGSRRDRLRDGRQRVLRLWRGADLVLDIGEPERLLPNDLSVLSDR